MVLTTDECELYFNEIEQDLDFLDRENGKYVGRARGYSYVNQTVQSFPDIRRRRLVMNASEIKKIWPIKDIVYLPAQICYRQLL